MGFTRRCEPKDQRKVLRVLFGTVKKSSVACFLAFQENRKIYPAILLVDIFLQCL
jgi:hypothetical protein